MSSSASTSALRLLGGGSLRQSFATVNLSRRFLHSSAVRCASSNRDADDTTPAREHRSGTSTSRASGGPDLDPFTSAPRNSSTATSSSAQSRGADLLADLAQGLTNSHSTSTIPHFNLPETTGPAAGNTPPGFVAPSGYSTEALPLRVDPTLEAFVNNLMKDGKKATATRHVIDMLQYLQQALHADPLPALQAAITSAGPLVRMQTKKSGGKNIAVPIALRQEQSRRKAIVAIIEASKKRGEKKLSVRLAKEVIAVLEGASSTLTKKEELHRLAMVNRSNMGVRV